MPDLDTRYGRFIFTLKPPSALGNSPLSSLRNKFGESQPIRVYQKEKNLSHPGN
jgi:hypothetical protein